MCHRRAAAPSCPADDVQHPQGPLAGVVGREAQARVQGGVHHRQRQQEQGRGTLLAHQVGPEGPGDTGREPRGLAERQAGVVLHAGALQPAHGLVVAEAQVVEADAGDRPRLGPQGGELGRQGLAVLRGGEGGVQPHLPPGGAHGGGQRRPVALVHAPRRAVEAVGVAPDQEDRGSHPPSPGALQQVGHVVPRVRAHQRGGEPARPAAAGDPGQPAGGAPAQAVDVVRQGDAPGAGRRDAQPGPQGGEVALHRGVLQVEARDPPEGAGRQGQPAELVALGHAQLVPPGEEVEGARDQVARDRPLGPGGREEQGEVAAAVRRRARERPVPLEEGLGGEVGGDPEARGGGIGGVDEVRLAVGPHRPSAERLGQRLEHPAGAGREGGARAVHPQPQLRHGAGARCASRGRAPAAGRAGR